MIEKAIKKINVNAEFTINADDINQITWLNGTTPISKEDIEAKVAELKTAYDNAEYQRDRAVAYPSIGDQLDMLWHAIDTDTLDKTSDFYTALKAVKTANPKPE